MLFRSTTHLGPTPTHAPSQEISYPLSLSLSLSTPSRPFPYPYLPYPSQKQLISHPSPALYYTFPVKHTPPFPPRTVPYYILYPTSIPPLCGAPRVKHKRQTQPGSRRCKVGLSAARGVACVCGFVSFRLQQGGPAGAGVCRQGRGWEERLEWWVISQLDCLGDAREVCVCTRVVRGRERRGVAHCTVLQVA